MTIVLPACAVCGASVKRPRSKLCSRRCAAAAMSGERARQWRGDAATPTCKRGRARKTYKLDGVRCERCPKPASDRHHKDGDTGNNAPSNIAFLCRRCHMLEDGRLARLAAKGKEKTRLPPRPCIVCERLVNVLRRGRCGRCNEYHRTHGKERPLLLSERHSVIVDGVQRTFSEWAELTGLPGRVIRERIRTGWDPVKAVTVPVRLFKARAEENRRAS